jgi:hypothetical protein
VETFETSPLATIVHENKNYAVMLIDITATLKDIKDSGAPLISLLASLVWPLQKPN